MRAHAADLRRIILADELAREALVAACIDFTDAKNSVQEVKAAAVLACATGEVITAFECGTVPALPD